MLCTAGPLSPLWSGGEIWVGRRTLTKQDRSFSRVGGETGDDVIVDGKIPTSGCYGKLFRVGQNFPCEEAWKAFVWRDGDAGEFARGILWRSRMFPFFEI